MLKNQKNLKLMLASFLIALSSLACLQTVMVPEKAGMNADPAQMETATAPENVKESLPTEISGLDIPATNMQATRSVVTCAKVIASDALNIREGMSDQTRILAWLKNNDVVVIADMSNADWWKIESPVLNGYVRSVYLKEVECE